MKNDYQHPIALPLFFAAVAVAQIVVNFGEALSGDWIAASVVIGFVGVGAVCGYDLFRRFGSAPGAARRNEYGADE